MRAEFDRQVDLDGLPVEVRRYLTTHFAAFELHGFDRKGRFVSYIYHPHPMADHAMRSINRMNAAACSPPIRVCESEYLDMDDEGDGHDELPSPTSDE